jgi:hypothetical protein
VTTGEQDEQPGPAWQTFGVGMSDAASAAIAAADIRTVAFEEDTDGGRRPVLWLRSVDVTYTPADSSWRPAQEGETCIAGAGGKGAWRSKACGAPAVVTQESMRGTKPYRAGRCEVHAGGRLPLEDGRVIEPVNNPLGGA